MYCSRLTLAVLLTLISAVSASAETLHIKLPSLPLTLTDSPEYESYWEERHFTTKYKVKVSSKENRAVITVSVFVKLDYTLYGDRRQEPYEGENPDEPEDLVIGSDYQRGWSETPILYEGKATPYLQPNLRYDRWRERVISGSTDVVRWEVMFPTDISDRIAHASVMINQGAGIIKLTIPDPEQPFKESRFSSDLNLIKYLPVCRSVGGYDSSKCFFDGLYPFRKIDAVGRKQWLMQTASTSSLTASKMTPLQRKAFRKSGEYKLLVAEMRRDRKVIPTKLFCFKRNLGTYSLKHKGLEISDPTLFRDASNVKGSLRFSNLGKPITKSRHRPVVSRTFLRVSEEDGLALENQEVLACFRVPKRFPYREGRVSGRTPIGRYTQRYRFLDVTLDMIYLKGQPYLVGKRGRVRKI